MIESVLEVGEGLGAREPDLFLVAGDAIGIEGDVAVLALEVVIADFLDVLSDTMHRWGIDDEAAGRAPYGGPMCAELVDAHVAAKDLEGEPIGSLADDWSETELDAEGVEQAVAHQAVIHAVASHVVKVVGAGAL